MTESSTTISQILENIRGRADYKIDEIKNLLRPFIEKIDVETVTIPAETFLYRAIKIGKGFGKRKKSKPADFQHLREIKDVKIGRVNRKGHPMLYCSLSKEPPFFEIELFNGNELMMGFWQTSKSITLVNIGYTKSVFEKYKANRPHDVWHINQALNSSTATITHSKNYLPNSQEVELISNDKDRDIKEAVSEAFMQEIGNNQKYKYKLTTAIAELCVEKCQNVSAKIAGVIYPSSKMRANGDNIALNVAVNPNLYEEIGLTFKKVMHYKITNISGKEQTVTFNELDQSLYDHHNLDVSWLGRLSNWKIHSGRTGRVVLEPQIDKDGDYKHDMHGIRCNWVMYDESGNIIEPL
jgi:hypothetical protein